MSRCKYIFVAVVAAVIVNSVICIHTFLDDMYEYPFLSFINRHTQVVQDVIEKPKGSSCSVTRSGIVVYGSCTNSHECLLNGGRPYVLHGQCGVLSSCCTQIKRCAEISSTKVAYFTSDGIRNFSECRHIIKLTSRRVCQIRLDFERFSLAQPTFSELNADAPTVDCLNDKFVVGWGTANNLPVLCGENAGHHMYIHLDNPDLNYKKLELAVFLADRNNTANVLPYPSWRIKITQLECPSRVIDPYKYSQYAKTIPVNDEPAMSKHLPYGFPYLGSTAQVDFDLLAPPGCLQYYPNPTGTFRSFNFNANLDYKFITGMEYAICFRRTSTCGTLSMVPTVFEISPPAPCIDAYLLVPGGYDATGLSQEKFCGTLTPDDIISTDTQGPLYVVFKANYNSEPFKGYLIDYKYIPATCL